MLILIAVNAEIHVYRYCRSNKLVSCSPLRETIVTRLVVLSHTPSREQGELTGSQSERALASGLAS